MFIANTFGKLCFGKEKIMVLNLCICLLDGSP